VQQLRDSRGPGAAPGASRAAAEPMVRCETCGLNLPQSEALTLPAAGGERWFCSEEHRRAAAPR
jgi:hypothetical protein